MKLKSALLIVMVSLLAACGGQKEPEMTPLEIQSMQTRGFSSNFNTVFASTMSVFQDLGYTITSADKATGLIAAESATDSDGAFAFWTGTTKTEQTRATAFIERINKKTNVRLNFVEKTQTSTGYGQSNRRDKPILEMSLYQNAFERIENAIFVRQ